VITNSLRVQHAHFLEKCSVAVVSLLLRCTRCTWSVAVKFMDVKQLGRVAVTLFSLHPSVAGATRLMCVAPPRCTLAGVP